MLCDGQDRKLGRRRWVLVYVIPLVIAEVLSIGTLSQSARVSGGGVGRLWWFVHVWGATREYASVGLALGAVMASYLVWPNKFSAVLAVLAIAAWFSCGVLLLSGGD
jgi:hypothetical protein